MTPAARQLEKARKAARQREKDALRQRRAEAGERANKYDAKRVTVEGITFDSKREARVWMELRLAEKAGVIRDLERQVPIMLEGRDGPLLTRTGRQMRLTVDFRYIEVDGDRTVWADAKGMPTPDYEVRRAAAQAMGYAILEL